MSDKADKELDALRIRSLCVGLETYWEPPETTHWQALHKVAGALRDTVSKAFAVLDAITGDSDLTDAARKRKMQERATALLATLDELDLEKASEAVAQQMRRWNEKIGSFVKPAETEAEAVLHAEIRQHIASLQDEARMSFLEKNGADPRVASSVLEAPAFLSNIGSAEATLIRAKIEKQFLSPEIIEAKAKAERALAELARAPRAARAMIADRAGIKPEAPLPKAPEPAPKPKSKPNFKTPKTTKEPDNSPAPVWADT